MGHLGQRRILERFIGKRRINHTKRMTPSRTNRALLTLLTLLMLLALLMLLMLLALLKQGWLGQREHASDSDWRSERPH